MNKSLNRYSRKIHRWLAVPAAIVIPIVLVLKLTLTGGEMVQVVQKVQTAQQMLVLVLAVTGIYLFLLPYLTKWRRRRTQRTPIPAKKGQ